MELKITELQLPGKISFNYEELKQELTKKVKEYGSLVYTDAQIREAKADRANLNRLKKALNDERIRQERDFMKPFDEFKGQVRELCGIVDSASAAIVKTAQDGTQTNLFNDRNKESYIFEKIQPGVNSVTWDGSFNFSVTILEERSEPKWI